MSDRVAKSGLSFGLLMLSLGTSLLLLIVLSSCSNGQDTAKDLTTSATTQAQDSHTATDSEQTIRQQDTEQSNQERDTDKYSQMAANYPQVIESELAKINGLHVADDVTAAALIELLKSNIRSDLGKWQILYDGAFVQNGVPKRVSVFGTMHDSNSRELTVAFCILAKGADGWSIESYQPMVTTAYPQAGLTKASLLQIGADKWAVKLDSTDEADANHTTTCQLIEINSPSCRNLFLQSESFASGKGVDIAFMVKQNDQPYWDLLLKIKEKGHAATTTLLSYGEDGYEAIRAYPYISQRRSRHARGLPATDWDGCSASRKKISESPE